MTFSKYIKNIKKQHFHVFPCPFRPNPPFATSFSQARHFGCLTTSTFGIAPGTQKEQCPHLGRRSEWGDTFHWTLRVLPLFFSNKKGKLRQQAPKKTVYVFFVVQSHPPPPKKVFFSLSRLTEGASGGPYWFWMQRMGRKARRSKSQLPPCSGARPYEADNLRDDRPKSKKLATSKHPKEGPYKNTGQGHWILPKLHPRL